MIRNTQSTNILYLLRNYYASKSVLEGVLYRINPFNKYFKHLLGVG